MSELINNSKNRVEELKHLIREIHQGNSVEETKSKLVEKLGSVPYGEVVQAEEELIKEGMEREEILKFCDLHTEALKGNLQARFSKPIPQYHPIDIFMKENREVEKVIDRIRHLFYETRQRDKNENASDLLKALHEEFNLLMDIEKHYLKKENLLFPFLEKHEITGPPMVMWGKHDEVRTFLKSCFPLFENEHEATAEVVSGFIDLMLEPTVKAIEEMIYKEENILFPMCVDSLNDIEWYEIASQLDEIGYCLYSPEGVWKPEFEIDNIEEIKNDKVKFENGSLSQEELEGILNTIPLDLTFVDKDDKVKFFSHGGNRIFQRPKAVLGRQVQYCHPPSSVHIVNKILDDFKSGKQNSAKFWINFHGQYVHIAYYAVRNSKGEYLGTLEVTQDINEYKKLEGERRILQYDN
ncbi:DUF438 domain-containing protein [Melioribacter sp. OK-6-Me]|uniref:DUF438 domain-containing protein n=1 Tax=unclassified Melioribacter TaxID=2627329 RepID=UPI003EDA5AC0